MPCSDLCWVQGAQPCPYCCARMHALIHALCTCVSPRKRTPNTPCLYGHHTCKPITCYICIYIYVLKKNGRCAGLTTNRSTAAEAGRSRPRGPPSQGCTWSPPTTRAHTHTPVLRHEKKEVSTAVSVGRPTTNQELHHNSSTNVIAMH